MVAVRLLLRSVRLYAPRLTKVFIPIGSQQGDAAAVLAWSRRWPEVSIPPPSTPRWRPPSAATPSGSGDPSRATCNLEKAVLLRRLGLDDAAVRQAIAVERATQLPAALGDWLRERVTVELRRLTRMARGAHPRYDINRHIAVRRLANWLEGSDERPAEEADERTAGRVLNVRFVRHRAAAAKLRRRQA
ncbi:MAG: hypothetical protein V7704_08500 [Aurantimonas endophytica]|uniref:hypothetical protein n=1 Tax=Aurantimonas endophytica TaxID=1522175 RepID=UPI0030033AFA